MLTKLHEELRATGIRLRLVSAHATVRDLLRAEGLEENVG
jgi:STAS domain